MTSSAVWAAETEGANFEFCTEPFGALGLRDGIGKGMSEEIEDPPLFGTFGEASGDEPTACN